MITVQVWDGETTFALGSFDTTELALEAARRYCKEHRQYWGAYFLGDDVDEFREFVF